MDGLTPEELEKFRAISLYQLLGMPDTGRRIGIPCPIHQGTNNNFNIYPNNTYYCFKCCASGHNAIDLVRDLKGFPKRMSSAQFIEVLEELIPNL